MSAYYSLANGNGPSGNFSVANTLRSSLVNSCNNYNIPVNNAGLVPQNASVSTNSNVSLMYEDKYVELNADQITGMTGAVANLQLSQNVDPVFRKVATNNLMIGQPVIGLYPNANANNQTYQN
jgi:hypothetical protein